MTDWRARLLTRREQIEDVLEHIELDVRFDSEKRREIVMEVGARVHVQAHAVVELRCSSRVHACF